MNKILFTLDVEPDLHTEKYLGITEGLKKVENVFDKYKIKPILFVTCDCIEKYPKIFKRLKKKGWEISLHAYRHERFDELSYAEKEKQLKNSIKCFKKYLHIGPKGFRAPQHSIDHDTLDLLDKYKFKYDSSLTPLNLLQVFFFPGKFRLGFRSFLSKINQYKIRDNLIEIPASSLLLPFTSLTVRILPVWKLKLFVKLIKIFYRKPVFYAHSWDFIELKESRIDRLFPHKRFIYKLGKILNHETKS
jgi:peptidoglycan/xylan/chitin deacetylase (PgdA/CDA1 family)